MQNNLNIIADALVDGLEDIVCLTKKEIKHDNFKISFQSGNVKFLFSCSLHHLDMPWQITCQVMNDSEIIGLLEKIVNKDYDNPTYEITPFFLSKINDNINSLIGKIKDDVKKTLHMFYDNGKT